MANYPRSLADAIQQAADTHQRVNEQIISWQRTGRTLDEGMAAALNLAVTHIVWLYAQLQEHGAAQLRVEGSAIFPVVLAARHWYEEVREHGNDWKPEGQEW